MGSLPSSSKESMTSENVDQTFISKQFDFLNDEVYLNNRIIHYFKYIFFLFRILFMKCFQLQLMDKILAMKMMDQ